MPAGREGDRLRNALKASQPRAQNQLLWPSPRGEEKCGERSLKFADPNVFHAVTLPRGESAVSADGKGCLNCLGRKSEFNVGPAIYGSTSPRFARPSYQEGDVLNRTINVVSSGTPSTTARGLAIDSLTYRSVDTWIDLRLDTEKGG